MRVSWSIVPKNWRPSASTIHATPVCSAGQTWRLASWGERPARYPKELSRNVGSTIGAIRWTNACWPTRSTPLGRPSVRTPPAELGISTRGTGVGWYVRSRSFPVQDLQILLRVRLTRRHGDVVNARTATGFLDLLPSPLQRLATAHLVNPHVDVPFLPLPCLQCWWGLPCPGLLSPGVGACTPGTLHSPSPDAPVSQRFPPSTEHGAFPLCWTFGAQQRRSSRQRSEAWCCDLVPEEDAPLRLLASPRPDLRARVSPGLPPGGFRSTCVFPGARPFVCGCHMLSTSPCRVDETRSPWGTHVSSPPCRPHTPWSAGEEPMRLRLHRAGSTMPRRGPTGSSGGMAPIDDDPRVLHTPCRPHLAVGTLPSRALHEVAAGSPWLCPALAFVPGSGAPYLPRSLAGEA